MLGCAHLTPARVRAHLATMTRLFDEAGPAAAGSGLPFACGLSPAARAVAVDGAEAQIEAGEHREAVFWLVATCARALMALGRDTDPGFMELMSDLGHRGPADLHGQTGRTESFLPRLAELREEVLAAALT